MRPRGIWAFGHGLVMAFGLWHLVGHLPCMWPSPHVICSIFDFAFAEQYRLFVPPTRTCIYISSTPGLCKAWELVALGAQQCACSGLCLHIALALLRPNHYSHIPRGFPAEQE